MTKPNCLTCGLCCVAPYGQNAFCDMTAADVKRLPKKFRLMVILPQPIHHLCAQVLGRPVDPPLLPTHQLGDYTTCIALDGEVGKKVRCKIYESRPKTCRTTVKPGDKVCHEIRRAYAS